MSTWSKWRDSNSRPHGPEPCALPTALHLVIRGAEVYVLCRAWSGKRESNPQPSAWEATALPLSHFRTQALTRSIIASSGYFRYLPIISLLSLFVKSFYADLQKSFSALIHTMRDNARASRPVYYFERDGHFGFSAEQIKLYVRAVVMPVDFRYRAFPAL